MEGATKAELARRMMRAGGSMIPVGMNLLTGGDGRGRYGGGGGRSEGKRLRRRVQFGCPGRGGDSLV